MINEIFQVAHLIMAIHFDMALKLVALKGICDLFTEIDLLVQIEHFLRIFFLFWWDFWPEIFYNNPISNHKLIESNNKNEAATF